ncbi:L-threonylcarbamoyladenylate synthase [Vibrio marisflavi]|uniref:Threonylcarbamoyl-AMP synthase n=1 Tax=Vibrio marisflavi CECT 7928 TaxID=634439 RepID=A0ABM9A898_9VIBR|nr:L-threonylcarbamoyladenylate synthase [Vibrio marisflavi]CAH0541900.1 Threonylcarbamoyl-AMP synthase [Vibrio marisflavi CECT 7928]
MSDLQQAVQALQQGKVIAYPTEGVFGVGCDPDNSQAIEQLLAIKQRPVEKGLILIAGNFEQLVPYIDLTQLKAEQLEKAMNTWPGPVTWIMPASEKVTQWVSGEFSTIAVRVTDHPLVQALTNAFGKPITSTSANLSGLPPCKTTEEVMDQLGEQPLVVLAGKTGGRENPSEIRDIKNSKVLRQG